MSKSGTISTQSILGGVPVVDLADPAAVNPLQLKADRYTVTAPALPQDTVSPLALNTTSQTEPCIDFDLLNRDDSLVPNGDPEFLEKTLDLENDLDWLGLFNAAAAAAAEDVPDIDAALTATSAVGSGPFDPDPDGWMTTTLSQSSPSSYGSESGESDVYAAAAAIATAIEPAAKRRCPSPAYSSSSSAQLASSACSSPTSLTTTDVSPAYSPASSSSVVQSPRGAASSPGSDSDRKKQMNNVAAKKHRAGRRCKDQENDRLIQELRAENDLLRAEEEKLKRTLEKAKLKIQAALTR
ncbi:uncharacterized protein LOC135804582 [Sycon ciliatum]|uniref:uncharacterized protein LOC135804582 n=1 Tax=Sycon ciliatum TaxID=27933 RepID=UPI0031F66FE2